MYANRIRNWNVPCRPAKPSTQSRPNPMPPVGFVIAPIFFVSQQPSWQAQLYQAAYERAREAAEVPRHYRRFFSVWN
jgi:hypothetical protein